MSVAADVSARGDRGLSGSWSLLSLALGVVLVAVLYFWMRFSARRRLARSTAAGEFLMDGYVSFGCFPEPWPKAARKTVPLWERYHYSTKGLSMRAELSGDALLLRKHSRLQGRRPFNARLRLEDIRDVEVAEAHSTPIGKALLIRPASGPDIFLDTVMSEHDVEVLAAQLRERLPQVRTGTGGLQISEPMKASAALARPRESTT